MRLEERARRAAKAIHRSVQIEQPLQRLETYRRLRQRNQRVGAGILAVVLAGLGVLALTKAFGEVHRGIPAAPPSGRILYGVWNPRLQQSHWFIVRPDGSGTRDLRVVATCAVWWPDGSRILITNDAAAGPGQLLRPATIRPDGTAGRSLDGNHDLGLNLGCGDVSPDGTRLVLEGFSDRHPELDGIYTVRASDGGGLIRLTGGRDAVPTYSPDGLLVAFLRTGAGISPPGAGALFVIGANGSGLHRVTPWGTAFLGQSWSPDGRWILFQRPYGQLYVVQPDGANMHRIPLRLPEGAGALNPVWSPDGRWIAFSLARNGNANIYLVHPDGTGVRRVTQLSGENLQSPSWGP